MSTARTRRTTSNDSGETLALAEAIGRKLRGGEVIELVSDLGGGKTTFVKGLARGMGSEMPVRSPSFTLGNEYPAGDLMLHHFDFYRLKEPGILRDELAEVLGEPKTVVAVEWADITEGVLPNERLTILLKATDENAREITIRYPDSLEYVIDNT